MRPLSSLVDGLLELLFPERCVVCDRGHEPAAWAAGVSGSAPGLRSWHAPHLCAACFAHWDGEPCAGRAGGLSLRSAAWECEALVKAVGAWKYHGLRGLARPFAALLAPTLTAIVADEPAARLVPLPLHHRRRRERGFDQCRQLAVLAGRAGGLPVAGDVLVRRRATGQQASCAADGDDRARNVAGAFTARRRRLDEPATVVLLDDLATTGSTLAAAAEALADAGWQVTSLVALGQAHRLGEGRG